MPSKSSKQARFMAAAAHNPKFAKRVGIKPSVAREFNRADTGTKRLSNAMKKKRYQHGGLAQANYQGPTGMNRADLLKRFPAYSGPMATTNPVTGPSPYSGYNPFGGSDVPGMPPRNAGPTKSINLPMQDPYGGATTNPVTGPGGSPYQPPPPMMIPPTPGGPIDPGGVPIPGGPGMPPPGIPGGTPPGPGGMFPGGRGGRGGALTQFFLRNQGGAGGQYPGYSGSGPYGGAGGLLQALRGRQQPQGGRTSFPGMIPATQRPNDLLRTAGAPSARYGNQLNRMMGRMRFAEGGKVKRAVAALRKAKEALHDSDPDFDHIASLLSKDIPGGEGLASKIRKTAAKKPKTNDPDEFRGDWQKINKEFKRLLKSLESD